ncbi:MAG: OstA-like protein [Salibacteraceae bacterium]
MKENAFYLRCFLLAGLMVGSIFSGYSQEDKPKKTQVELLGATELVFDDDGAQKLIGNVKFGLDGAIMNCDSAYLYKETNKLNAYGRVHIEQGDTIHLYGDTLLYDGATRLARMRGNIKMIDSDAILTTEYLDYNRASGYAFYLGGGKIVSKKEDNTLTSEIGYYYPDQRSFYFRDSVKLKNQDYNITSDTLKYNNSTEVATFLGPTYIRTKEDLIYCEAGWYDTRNNRSEFRKNAYVESKDQRLGGDSLVYDRALGIGEAFGNVSILDTASDFLVYGDYAFNSTKDSTSIVTGHAMLVQIFDEDSLFLHGDTLYSTYDSTGQYRLIFAFEQVKFFKSDMQGKCDSLVFSDADSTIRMFYDPVLWSDENQITADDIIINSYDGKIKSMQMDNNAFIISQEDSIHYNQIKGKSMTGLFKQSQLSRVDVRGNGQTIYYASEDGGDLIGVNEAVCSDLIIYIDSSKVKRINFLNQPVATLHPLSKVTPEKMQLGDFVWLGDLRPLRKEDIFYWNGRAPIVPGAMQEVDEDSTAIDSLFTAPIKEEPKVKLTRQERKELRKNKRNKLNGNAKKEDD